MGAVEDTRKVIQDCLAHEIRTVSANMETLPKEQARLRQKQLAEKQRILEEFQKQAH